jgi:aminoglycoside phosphotransferase (APT) family kinase protein
VDLEGRRLTTPDVWFDDVALAVMLHSRGFHAGVLDWEATVVGDEDLENAGAIVTGVTPQSVTHDPVGTLGRVEAAYQRAQRWPRERGILAQPRSALPMGPVPSWSQRVS